MSIIRPIYKGFIKPILFLFDPEKVHDGFLILGKLLGSNSLTRSITRALFNYKNPALEQTIAGMKFKNPIGLAAGFDKNAVLTNILPDVGFGFEEAGSITGEPCEGNAKPRLWRLNKSNALVVYYGLTNDGAEQIAKRLFHKKFRFPVGISIAKTNCPKTASKKAGIADYVKANKAFEEIGNYLAVNISCPNAFGGEPFTNPKDLDDLLAKIHSKKPIFIKLPPDLTNAELDKIIKVTDSRKIAGFVCTNLTKDRKNKSMMSKIKEKSIPGNGGISGKPVEELADNTIAYIYKKTKGRYVIMGCGGIFSARDAYKKIKLGASLVQLITGMIYEGPQLIGEINRGLVKLLKEDGFKNISEAIGKDNPI